MGRDAGHGEWVYYLHRGHEWNLKMFKCYYEGHDTYTLKYGKRELRCNREHFIKKEDMSTQVLSVLQIEEAMMRRDREHLAKNL